MHKFKIFEMTYIVGTIKNNVSYLIGDTVITSTSSESDLTDKIHISEAKSSFGEVVIREHRRVIQESTIKMWSNEDSILIAFAGNAKDAYEVVQNILQSPSITINPIETVNYFTRHNPSIQLLISLKTAADQINLFNYNVDSRNETALSQEGKVYHLGNISDEHKEISETFIKELFDLNLNLDLDLEITLRIQITCAFLQTFVYTNTFANGIGGVYIGAIHKSDSINYQKDVAYLLMEGDNINSVDFSCIGVLIREGKTIVNSPFLSRPYRILIPYIPRELTDKINSSFSFTNHNILEEIHEKINNLNYDFYIIMYKNAKTGRVRLLVIPNHEDRVKKIMKLSSSTVTPRAQNLIDSIKRMIDDEGEIIEVL